MAASNKKKHERLLVLDYVDMGKIIEREPVS
jgi:hypothetical protein